MVGCPSTPELGYPDESGAFEAPEAPEWSIAPTNFVILRPEWVAAVFL